MIEYEQSSTPNDWGDINVFIIQKRAQLISRASQVYSEGETVACRGGNASFVIWCALHLHHQLPLRKAYYNSMRARLR